MRIPLLAVTSSLLCISATARAATGDACALLTTAQVSAALGVTVDPGATHIPNHPEFCIWREHGKDAALARNVQVSFLTQKQYETGKTPLPNIPKTPESGIGDEAYFTNTPGVGYILSFKKGSSYIRVQARAVSGFSRSKGDADKAIDEKFKTVERAIAHDILNQL